MQSFRVHGRPPYRVVVLHGGPGAAGEMAPVARELSARFGVLEPLQRADSVDGQVEELRGVLKAQSAPPAIVIGYSWGAWLGFILAAKHPTSVSRLVLVSSGPFAERYAARIAETRLSRLSASERAEVPGASLERLGELFGKADAYDPLPGGKEDIEIDPEIFKKVWPEAAALRRSGRLLDLGQRIECPVLAIHGDYDPHPAEGVRQPLAGTIRDFEFALLKDCGHKPWMERAARRHFFEILSFHGIIGSVVIEP